jgi:hypothetical protein
LFICDRCVVHASRLAAGVAVDDRSEVPLGVEPSDSRFKCSFCGKQARQVRHLVASGLASAPGGKFDQGTRICDRCLRLCEEILAETVSS